MADDKPELSEPGDTANANHGTVDRLVQARDIHGGVTFVVSRDRLVMGAVTVVALLVAAVIVFLTKSTPTEPDTSTPSAEPVADPLLVAVRKYDDMCGLDWLTQKPPSELSTSPADVYEWGEWKLVSDGIPVERSELSMTVHGTGPHSVVIHAMKIKVDRARPMVGTRLEGRCGDAEFARFVEVDLDDPDPRPVGRTVHPNVVRTARENGWRATPVQFPYEVSAQDSETFVIGASTQRCDCSWTVELEWSSGGRRGTTVVDDDGKPFRLTADVSTTTCNVVSYFSCAEK